MRFNASTTLQKKSQNGRSLYNYTCFGEKTTFLNLLRNLMLKIQKGKELKYVVSRMYLNMYVCI